MKEAEGMQNMRDLSDTKVQMFIKTNGLEYDDRLKKECLSVAATGAQVSVLSMLDNNLHSQGKLYGQSVNNRSLSLCSRRWLKSRRFLPVHLLEFCLRAFMRSLKGKVDIVWVHDPVLVVLMPQLWLLKKVGMVKRIVWDHHELPPKRIDQSPVLRWLFARFTRLADVSIQANDERSRYFRQHYLAEGNTLAVINNYPDREYVNSGSEPLPDNLSQWLNGRQYFLVQSGAVAHRHFYPLMQALLPHFPDIAIVHVGGADKVLLESVRAEYSDVFDNQFFDVGKIPQTQLSKYLHHALASIILYQREFGINNWLCEPNRLYQAIARQIPVLVGNNPVMARVVKHCMAGVVLNDDGSDVQGITESIHQLLEAYEDFYQVNPEILDAYRWEKQTQVFLDILNVNKG